jgi:D-glycerate 3-kinase
MSNRSQSEPASSGDPGPSNNFGSTLKDDHWSNVRWAELWDQAGRGASGISLAAIVSGDRAANPTLEDEQAIAAALLRAEQLRAVIPKFTEFCQGLTLDPIQMLPLLWRVALPLAQELEAAYRQQQRPIVQGILGGQGVGKSTLAALLQCLLASRGLTLVSLSLDDLYKTHADRQALLRNDPRLIWRGPPGTHDLDLGLATLDRLRQAAGPIPIPRFDKSLQGGSGDRIAPEWVESAQIIIFEGWFVGAKPIDPRIFDEASGGDQLPKPICTAADRAFARDCNARLADYLPLWARLDRLLILAFSDYRQSKTWRRRAEQRMREAGKAGMSDDEIDGFVDYFWRALHPDLFIEPLLTPKSASNDRPTWVVRYGADRQIESINHP